uniref:F-box domain-containing protein n=1 Tax=Meloidogyne enterolobii TaxID=390850 RepID=A0A6V7WNR8_MELEN|nr:unnamed protein product [Meloidogyne enterolobii]
MYFLPFEVQLDIFKFFTSDQLFDIQQTNIYLKNFINEFEEKLARKEFYKIQTLYHLEWNLNKYKFFKPDPILYDFQLSEELEKKWKCGIEERIPIFLSDEDTERDIAAINIEINRQFGNVFCSMIVTILLQNIPKNIEDMKISRCFFQQIFECAFRYVEFDTFIFNPQMIELLFDGNKTNIPLQIHSRMAKLSIYNERFLKFALNHLISNKFNVKIHMINRIEQLSNNLLKLLTNRGNGFYSVYYDFLDSSFYNLIIQYIETSKNLSKMVKEIRCYNVAGDLIISERAENVKEEVRYNNLKSRKYQLSNEYNSEMKFSISNNERDEFWSEFEVKRIN